MTRNWGDWLAGRLSRVTSGAAVVGEIDGLRLIPILLVVLHHIYASYLVESAVFGPVQFPKSWDAIARENFWVLVASRGNYGVHMFFVISGFVLALPFLRAANAAAPPPNLGRYYLRRLTRLEPPYVVALLVAYAIHGYNGKSLADLFPHLLASIFYLHGLVYGTHSEVLGIAWSLEVEAQFYLMMPLLAALLFRLPRRKLVITALAIIWGIGAQAAIGSPRVPAVFDITLLRFLPYFLAGFVLADCHLTRWATPSTKPLRWDAAALFAALLLAGFLIWQPRFAFLTWRLQPLTDGAFFGFAMPWLLFVVYAAVFRGRVLRGVLTQRWAVITGGMCYSAYLYHNFAVGLSLRPIYGLIGGALPPAWECFVLALLILPAVFVLTAVMFALVERPFMRAARG